jgi:hypothetical protein
MIIMAFFVSDEVWYTTRYALRLLFLVVVHLALLRDNCASEATSNAVEKAQRLEVAFNRRCDWSRLYTCHMGWILGL